MSRGTPFSLIPRRIALSHGRFSALSPALMVRQSRLEAFLPVNDAADFSTSAAKGSLARTMFSSSSMIKTPSASELKAPRTRSGITPDGSSSFRARLRSMKNPRPPAITMNARSPTNELRIDVRLKPVSNGTKLNSTVPHCRSRSNSGTST